ncbi:MULTISPECIES: restriction endonuclease [unclassified Lentimicrobium]|uniref:restriction endonuclease n=1 Tax=unclassified Lentimicrobium TaxID=2677434 RepID=UPI00155325EB|nr:MULTISPECIES: restriction endonuclease [unclassified Lentimicrobium]NPD44090.1 ATP-binding protein [Lentimicrobium sp. S6]NPD86241.1 ATP-binding protein [Lentimicrobium sp. L6]
MTNTILHKNIIIRKASGDEEIFEISKLERSLHNSGADRKSIMRVVHDIENWVYDGVTTKKIYSRAFSLLKRDKGSSAMRYKLKKAIFELGPTGYPFEQYMGQLFAKQGYEIEVGVVVNGHCLSHEMDVVATKKHIQHIMECKYHKDQGKTVSIQVPLYVRSRVNDIIRKREQMPEFEGLSFKAWVVTNTRFSPDSIKYGNCSGMKLLAWDYPQGHGLKDMIERVKVFPITVLTQLTKKEKLSLMDKDIISCEQLLKNQDLLTPLNLPIKKQTRLLDELHHICG